MAKLKPGIHIIRKGELRYLAGRGGRLLKFKPWLGDSFSFLYDFIMTKSVFPGKFGADLRKHYSFLSGELSEIHGRRILELGTGSGSAVWFLNSDNEYAGTDVSPGLLKQAAKRFFRAGFPAPEFYVASADDLPFENGGFDLCLCMLSLNFIGNVEKVFQEVYRLLISGGVFVCSVPVPEKNRRRSTIRGVLYSEEDLRKICLESGFSFDSLPCDNGALLYFRATKQG